MILFYLLTPVLVIVIAIVFLRSIVGGIKLSRKRSRLDLFSSPQDALAQFYMLLAVIFFGLTVWALNIKFDSIIDIDALLLITSLVGLVVAYYFKTILILPFSILGIISWWFMKAAQWVVESGNSYMYGLDASAIIITLGSFLICILFYVIGRYHQAYSKFDRYGLTYFVLGFLGLSALLFWFSSEVGLYAVEAMKNDIIFNAWQIGVSFLIFLVAYIAISMLALKKSSVWWVEVLYLTVIALFFLAIPFIGSGELMIPDPNAARFYTPQIATTAGLVWSFIFNILLVTHIFGTIYLGHHRKENWLMNIGLAMIIIFIAVKYFDWFYSYLSKSVFFIVSGLLLIISGWLILWVRKRFLKAPVGAIPVVSVSPAAPHNPMN